MPDQIGTHRSRTGRECSPGLAEIGLAEIERVVRVHTQGYRVVCQAEILTVPLVPVFAMPDRNELWQIFVQ